MDGDILDEITETVKEFASLPFNLDSMRKKPISTDICSKKKQSKKRKTGQDSEFKSFVEEYMTESIFLSRN